MALLQRNVVVEGGNSMRKFIFIYALYTMTRRCLYWEGERVKSLAIDTAALDTQRKMFWCFFWANRKAIRTEGCAPFLIEKIMFGDTAFTAESGKILTLSNEVLTTIEENMNRGESVKFTIRMGTETFDFTFHNNVFSVAAQRNQEIEAEIIESLHEELIRGKPNFCSSFLKRVGITLQI